MFPSQGQETPTQLGPLERANLSHWTAPVKVRVTLQLAVYRQSVRLGVKPLECHYQRFFFQLNPCGNSPYVTSCLTRTFVCLL
jgi:hypothetical protein